jgi:hypothetical protein
MAAAGPSSVVGWPIVGCGSGRSIASVSWRPGLPDDLVAEIGANARLIAAAPDGYSVVARIREAGIPLPEWAASAADAFLAKARGEQ